MRFIVSIFFAMILTLTTSLAEDNDTAFTSNILPNAGDTTSSYSNANLDGVTTGSSATTLTNNLVYNGFTITCDTQVSNACGSAHPSIGEIEASHDLTVTATGSLVGVTGTSTPDGVSHTSTQAKLNGGINLSSSVSVQNCEWSSSSYRCGSYTGAVDSYTITMKIKDSDGNVLASSTKIRTDDAGYNANARTFDDNLHYNGVHANTYEWSWKGVDGSESTSVAVRGPNLLGAEMALDFPTDDYEALSQAEIEEINEALGTANLTESEIWNVISGIEESIGMEFNVATEGAVVSVELNEETMSVIVYTSEEASVKQVAMVQEVIQTMKETKAVETLKKEVIQEVMKEIYEEPKATQTKSFAMVSKEKAVSSKKEETKVSKAPPGMTPAKEEEKEEVKEEQPIVKETQEEKEVAKEESSTKSSAEVSSASTSEQKKIEAKKALVKNLDRVMNKVDADIKDIAKNLQIKNLIKLEAMTSEQASLDLYAKALFYQPKDIYLQQLNIFDNRQIYDNVNLASYIKTDKVAIKANALHEINLKKQRLLIELEQLKNGKI
jgi:hypothetical protein